jgi:phospholipid-translocating ATPase
MNKYFLLIAVLQLWPLITPVSPVSTWGPLIVIFSVSATKEAWDDYGRYCSDKEFNDKIVWVVKNGVKTQVCRRLPPSLSHIALCFIDIL